LLSQRYTCALLSANSENITCRIVAGVGKNLVWQVLVEGVPSNVLWDVFSYPSPKFTSNTLRDHIGGETTALTAPTTKGEDVHFLGSFFGFSRSLITINYGPLLNPYLYTCFIPDGDLGDSAITCQTSAGSGGPHYFTATVGYGAHAQTGVSTDTYTYPSTPVLYGLTTNVASSNVCNNISIDSTPRVINCPTSGIYSTSTQVILTLTGQDFGSANAVVTVGGLTCMYPTHTSGKETSEVTCYLPVGTGLNLSVIISSGGIIDAAPGYLSYSLPTISNVTGCAINDTVTGITSDCERIGGTRITVTGQNFGYELSNVLIAGQSCSNVVHDTLIPHQRVTCTTPSGSDVLQSVALIQRRGGVTAMPARLSYTQCDVGYRSDANDALCWPCSNGTFTNVKGQRQCSICPVATYSNISAASICTSCAAGTYNNLTGQSSCSACPIGFASTSNGQSICSTCNGGTYANVSGMSYCTLCDTGSYSIIDVTTTSNSSGISSCTTCPLGTVASHRGSLTCIACASGTFANSIGLSSCTNCSAGNYSIGGPVYGASSCSQCGVGSISTRNGASSCASCAAGTAAVIAGMTSCTLCDIGSFSSDAYGTSITSGPSNCTYCYEGSYTNVRGSATCIACSRGTYTSTRNSTVCQLCEIGKFQNQTGQTQCLSCETGHYSGTFGSPICLPCPRGFYASTKNNSICTACPLGSYQDEDTSISCKSCPIGTAGVSLGMVACQACDAGFYSNATGLTSCLACPAGTSVTRNSTSLYGAASCIDCGVGQYVNVIARGTCSECDDGTYSHIRGLTVCYQCPPGNYSTRNSTGAGATFCNACIAGYYSSTNGSSECLPCPVCLWSRFPLIVLAYLTDYVHIADFHFRLVHSVTIQVQVYVQYVTMEVFNHYLLKRHVSHVVLVNIHQVKVVVDV
jgi:hypothetical protein